ncbi:MAG: PAS domain-containing sensor histidine kinase [Alphaproteobacteria bacterium]|nr:PAS domain-containing sensor histidine kinase [Alphaproteobacteria bacterium]
MGTSDGRDRRSWLGRNAVLATSLVFVALGLGWLFGSYSMHRIEDHRQFQALVGKTAAGLEVFLDTQRRTLDFAARRLEREGAAGLPALACDLAADRTRPGCEAALTLLASEDAAGAPWAACAAPLNQARYAAWRADAARGSTYFDAAALGAGDRFQAPLIRPMSGGRALAMCVDFAPVLREWEVADIRRPDAIGLFREGPDAWVGAAPDAAAFLPPEGEGAKIAKALRAALDYEASDADAEALAAAATGGGLTLVRRPVALADRPVMLAAGYPAGRGLADWARRHWPEIVIVGLICLAAPISARFLQRATERPRSESQALQGRLEMAAHAGGVGFWSYDFRSDHLTWSPDMFRIFGVAGEDFGGRFADWRDRLHPDDLEAAEAAFLERSRTGAPTDLLFRIMRESDGAERWVRGRCEFTLDAAGAPLTAEGVNQDATREMEEQARLGAALHQAHEAVAARESFLATLSHEVRTPLNAILGFADLMRQLEPDGLSAEKRAEYLDDIHRSGEHLLSLINDMLDLAQLDQGAPKLKPEAIALSEAVSGVRRFFEPRIAGTRLDFSWDAPPSLPPVFADRRALNQILLNLMSNAVKFTPPGGRIRVVCRRAGGGLVEVVVEDTGRGIPPAKLQRLGAPFEKVDGGYHASGEGAGLGLAIVRRLADAMGGRLALESEFGSWTRARVLLPAAEPDMVGAEALQPASTGRWTAA